MKQKVISMSKIQLNLSYNVVEMRVDDMKKRYLKVLALFSVSTLIPTVLLNSKAIDNSAIKYVLKRRWAMAFCYRFTLFIKT